MIARRVVFGCALIAMAAWATQAAVRSWRAGLPERGLRDLAGVSGSFRWSEMRIPGARFTPARAPSHALESEVRPPSRFFEIRAEIARNLAQDTEAPAWLQVQGRSDLLLGRSLEAIQTLRAASDLGVDNADLWNDLGVAYYSLSLQNASADEDTLAVEALGRAASQRPYDPAIRYNLGCALERLHIFDAAEENFQASVAAENDPQWRRETAARLNAAIDSRRRLFSLPAGLEIPGTLEDRMERAFTEELAAGWSGTGRDSLKSTARRLLDVYGDRWMSEAADLIGDARYRGSVEALSAMARVRAKGRFDQYEGLERDFESLGQLALPPALAAWRDFEALFRASHAGNLRQCPDTGALFETTRRRRYRALEIETLLETSTCQNGNGHLDDAFDSANSAVKLADKCGYTSLGLRAKGFLVSDFVNQGRYREAYQMSNDCLADILKDGMPIRRAHQFYHTIERAAERLEHWYSARAAVQMAREVAGAFGSSVYEMIAQYKRADYSGRLALWRDADLEYQEALRLYQQLPATADVQSYASAARAGLLESRKDYEELARLRATLEDSSNAFLEAPVDVALARIALERHLPNEARLHASHLINWLDRHNVPGESDRNQFRKMLQRASIAETRALLELDEPAAALDAWRQFLKRDARLMGAEVSAAESPGDSVIVTIADLEIGLGVWMQSRNGIRFHWAEPDRRTAILAVRRLRRLCADPKASPSLISQAEAAVWRIFFASAIKQARGVRQLRVEAEGELTAIPLSLLVFDYEASGMPQDTSFTPYPIAAHSTARGRPILVSASQTNPELGRLAPLPRAHTELLRVASSVEDSRLIEGKAATPASIEQAMATARLFHFVGHAVRWRDGSALAVAPDPADPRPEARAGILKITPQMRISAELVSLWACSTGYADDNETLSPSRLAEAALVAGAHHVVASLWDVDSGATAEFEAAFYRWWGSGRNFAEAIQRASADVRGLPQYAHPYYWAGFALYQSEK
jgi:CHAT domain-containing protein